MTLIMTPHSDAQRDLLMRLADELHIKVQVVDDSNSTTKDFMRLSESSLAKVWDTEEDAHWDAFFKLRGNVSEG
jgi:hypothetical protein